MSINDQIPNYDAWKMRSPYEPGEIYGPDEHDYEPDLDDDRLEPDHTAGVGGPDDDELDEGDEEDDIPF